MKFKTAILRFAFLICSLVLLTSCVTRKYAKRILPADKIKPIPVNPNDGNVNKIKKDN
ncbi:MAG TPA: hypothetical protein PLJ60_13920 [Chryseolinea sp.]|nr:hypothetical protein [Chryseolinea sp.]HPM31428.1 hypothetical protein [Chryseolinea sp.]